MCPRSFTPFREKGRDWSTEHLCASLLCNLTCVWCDTPYTWNWDDKSLQHESDQRYRREDEQSLLGFDELTRLSLEHACSNFVITGGEPMVQFKRLEKWFAHVREAYTRGDIRY